MNRPAKVLHLETGMNLYGGAQQVLYLLRGLSGSREVRNVLVCPSGSGIAEASREHVRALYTVPMKGDLDLPFIPRLIRIIREEKPDIVHLHSRRGADILGGVAAKLTSTPCILTRRVDNTENRLWVKTKYRLYHRVITISRGIREVLLMEGVQPGKVTCVPSAVEIDPYTAPCHRSWYLEEFGLGEDERTCGVVAQFIERKGHRYLFEAIPAIADTLPGVRFLLFGKGPLEGELRSLCHRLEISDRVIFAGFREDLDRIFACLDLLIHPALMEGLGVSLLQAAAAGIPIVGTRVGGIPEILRDGENGCLIPPRDPSSLAEAVIRLLGDPDRARQLGETGRRIVRENFSIEAMVEGNLNVYREVMGKKSRVQSPESREDE